jgi:hypothetical protein
MDFSEKNVLLRNAQKRDKTIEQNNRGGVKKNGETNSPFFS